MGIKRKMLMVGLALGLTACSDLTNLDVTNTNNPETERALASAADTEALIGGTFLTYWEGTQGSNPYGALATGADEGSASWGNWGMRDYSSEPRVPWNNASSYGSGSMTQDPWDAMYVSLSSAADGILAIEAGLEIGNGGVNNPRALAFAKFNQGMALGWLAMMFDQAIIFDETVDLAAAAGGAFEFAPYGEVMTAALGKMDEAITIAQSNNFTLPGAWINGLTPNSAEFIQIIHSFKARMMAHVARTPAERQAVNWNGVLAEIAAGITEDFAPQTSEDLTWFSRWTRHATEGATWMRADYKTFGWTDESGGYINWLNTPVASRDEFEMDTRDLRIWGCGPSGDGTIDPAVSTETSPGSGQCRSVDGTTAKDARIGGNDGLPNDQEPGRYFRFFGNSSFPANRGTYHWSMYHHWRYEDIFEDGLGPMRHILLAEMELLKAEAYLNTGQTQLAVDIINSTRVAAGLPAVTTTDFQCPPVKPGCTLLDQLAYEKRMETWNTNTGGAYFDRRGWGPPGPSTGEHHLGLVEGTPLHLPVPGAELEVLQLPTYTFGGVGAEFGAAPGFGVLSRYTASYEDIYAFEPGMTTWEKLRFIDENFRPKAGVELLARYR